jgi:hypothetical protein
MRRIAIEDYDVSGRETAVNFALPVKLLNLLAGFLEQPQTRVYVESSCITVILDGLPVRGNCLAKLS